MISRIKELSSENNSETLVVIDDTKAEQKFIDERISFIKGFVNTKNYKIIKLSEL
jgi:homospermidine synthase